MKRLQTKLFGAATQNSITLLQQLLIDDPLIVERALVNRFNETPLHFASTNQRVATTIGERVEFTVIFSYASGSG
ncbi:hypothetical protein AAHA92_32589 [Salvia divinorum]|uniref:Ankyrin repeat protein n=1 Tax=Salvia divinorum TaxID=28513 RepID=A0ABD1FL90_SALDI